MESAAFDYDLPPERIAQRPIEPRDAARLLVDRGDQLPPRHVHVRDLPALVAPGDVVVVNDTRVLPARLALRKPTGGSVEVLLLERQVDGRWLALVRPSRKVPPGTRCRPPGPAAEVLAVDVEDDLGDGVRAVVLLPGAASSGGTEEEAELAAIETVGSVPLPPYLHGPLDDPERYQTVYARRPGSAAAPTAGLHLTAEVLAGVRAAGADVVRLELVVGLGTFRPLAEGPLDGHVMHAERYAVPEATWSACATARARGGRVLAIGTTALRALESVASSGQLTGRTQLFVRPGHRFAVVDRLLTNFHQPRSTLLVLVEAFVGPRWRTLYAEAAAAGYRFLSFGDAMLLDRDAR